MHLALKVIEVKINSNQFRTCVQFITDSLVNSRSDVFFSWVMRWLESFPGATTWVMSWIDSIPGNATESWVESIQNFGNVSWLDPNKVESCPGLMGWSIFDSKHLCILKDASGKEGNIYRCGWRGAEVEKEGDVNDFSLYSLLARVRTIYSSR